MCVDSLTRLVMFIGPTAVSDWANVDETDLERVVTVGMGDGIGRHTHDGQISPAKTRTCPAEHDRQQAGAHNVISKGMRRLMIFTHRAQDQSSPCFLKEPPHAGDDAKADVNHRVMLEHDGANDRNVAKDRDVPIGKRRGLHAEVSLPQQGREAEAKQRQRQTRRHLIGQEKLGQDAKHQRHASPPKGGHQKPDPSIARGDGGHKTEDRTGNHHPLNTEVQNACAFHHQFANRSEHDGGRGDHEGREQQDWVD